MGYKLTILGCHSATPRVNAHPTAQYLEINSRHFLIDCGEGTQRQMRLNKVGFSKINTIFISHLHGDHFFGLIGLISTFGILNREKELHIHGPKGIKEVINIQLKHSKSYVKYKIIFHELNSTESELIFEDEKVKVYTIPLHHRVYTNGFLFKEKEKSRKINISAVKKFKEIDVCDYNNLKQKSIIVNGKTVAIIKKKYKRIYLYPLKITPLYTILQKNTILNIMKTQKPIINNLNLIVYETSDKDNNKLKIFFDKKSLDLKGWETRDIYSNKVNFTVLNLEINKIIDENLFKIIRKKEL